MSGFNSNFNVKSNIPSNLNQNQQKMSNVLFYSTKCQTCNFFMTYAQKTGVLKHFKLVCIDGNERHFQTQGLKIIPTIIVINLNKPIEGKDCISWLENVIKMNSGKNFEKTNDQYLPETGILNSNQQQHPTLPNNKINNQVTNLNMGTTSGTTSGLTSGQTAGTIPIGSNPNGNQFQVPKTNIMKRNNELTAIAPPLPTTNVKGRQQNQIIPPQSQNNSSITVGPNNSNQTNGPSVKPVNQLFGFMENEMSGFSDSYAYLLVDNALPKSFLPPDKDLQIYTAPEGNKLDKKTQELYLKNMELFIENEKKQIKQKYEQEQNIILQNNLRK